MSYGFKVLKAADGTGCSWESPTARGLLFMESVACPAALNGVVTRSYPDFVGRVGQAAYFSPVAFPSHSLAWTYPSGIPTLTITCTRAGVGTVYICVE